MSEYNLLIVMVYFTALGTQQTLHQYTVKMTTQQDNVYKWLTQLLTPCLYCLAIPVVNFLFEMNAVVVHSCYK